MSTRNLMEKRMRKRIGNGEATSIRSDKWIPGNKDGRVTTEKLEGCQIIKLAQFITNFRWNRQLIWQLFNKEDSENILHIPISLAGRGDQWY